MVDPVDHLRVFVRPNLGDLCACGVPDYKGINNRRTDNLVNQENRHLIVLVRVGEDRQNLVFPGLGNVPSLLNRRFYRFKDLNPVVLHIGCVEPSNKRLFPKLTTQVEDVVRFVCYNTSVPLTVFVIQIV